jgi:hypothetical protein
MTAAIAARMTSADLLKLRKKPGTVIWSLVLALLPVLVFFVVRAAQHASDPAVHGPAGGMDGYIDALRIVAAFFGPLAAIMIGVEAGTGDVASGVFRDLVVTGRSRLWLFVTRVPAALALTWMVAAAGYVLVTIGTFALASGSPTPDAATMINGAAFTALSTGVICVVAVGFGALTASRPAALTALIGWHLVASPLLANISSLGSSRKLILDQAVAHFSPVRLGGHGDVVTMGQTTALAVTAVWLAVFLVLGAWRTRTMDA